MTASCFAPCRYCGAATRSRLPFLATIAMLAALALSPAAAQNMDKARAAQARGDLRAAQIEFRNVVRNNPNSAPARAALAAASLDVGDGDTAEKEARAALDRGYDRVAGTGLLLRAYLQLGRHRDLLRDFPTVEEPAAVGGQIAAARARAELANGDREAARRAVADALRLAPNALASQLAAAEVAAADNDRVATEAATDRALAIEPTASEALLRKGALTLERGEAAQTLDLMGRLLAAAPGNVPARLLRAEAYLRSGNDTAARGEVDAALRTQPNSAAATYLRALLLTRAEDWRGADDALQRLGASVSAFADGFLLQATIKRGLGQTAQALDAAQRHVARRPEEPRGAKLLAVMEMEAGRPGNAIAPLLRLDAARAADAEALDLLGRAQVAAGRPREAAEALQRAAALAPTDGGILARLAAARLASGDAVGTTEAARGSLALAPAQPGTREMLTTAALARGDLAAAEAEFAQLDPAAQRSEIGGTLAGIIRLGRLDPAGARTVLEAVLRDFPESVGARLGLARVAAAEGRTADVDRLTQEVLRRDPTNGEAISTLMRIALAGGPRAAGAVAALRTVSAAAPSDARVAVALASVLARLDDVPGAVAVLEAEALQAPGLGAALPLARGQAYIAANRWAEAEAATRSALAEDPSNIAARRQLAALLARNGDNQGAEALIEDGLRMQPGEPLLQQALVQLVSQARGLEPALALAAQIARRAGTLPAARLLPGELLLAAQRPVDAARAFAAAYNDAPSSALAQRQAGAWQAAERPNEAAAALRAWLAQEPGDMAVLSLLAQYDLQAGRQQDAEQRLNTIVERAPNDAVSLNNLAWILGEKGGPAAARGRALAERAYFLLPNPDVADTLGWIMARNGEARQAIPLLRLAAADRGGQPADGGMLYRLAFALRAAGDRAEAQRLLEPVVAGGSVFAERAAAERLLADLRAGR